ncbi:hypothetical protein FHS44_006059 [Streptosporangium saharense]|uniref:Uncharacterized protein n=1 Tax=Streptosporangium saharense TaxID=1706840 RepID=A0A7W7QSZ0_9ACTN|nr:hypothetical protein [Streptosporangium saharense]
MSLDNSTGPDGPLHARTALILAVATVIAACAAAPTWFMVNHVLDGTGGPLVPLSAALAVWGTHFVKIVDLLR